MKRAHLIGIGGIGMSGLARMLISLGWEVSGSDSAPGRETDDLMKRGVRVAIGHDGGNVGDPELVIYSSAIPPDNPELTNAAEKGIRCIRRGEAVAMLIRSYKVIAVTGTHGKTTSSAMLVSILEAAGRKPSYLIGGHILDGGSNYGKGEGEEFVLEADESDGTFLGYKPVHALITNIDCEHLGHYGSMEMLVDAFGRFADTVGSGGCLIAFAGDANVARILSRRGARIVTYGFENGDYRSSSTREGDGWRFALHGMGGHIGSCRLKVVGRHNLLNATGVAALSLEMGCRWEDVAEGLARCSGVSRRFEIKLDGPVTVVDDYAHHPAEVSATLSAARAIARGRLIALWQPHRPSRCRDLFDEWLGAFGSADVVYVTDIYAAGESALPGITGERMAGAILSPDVRFAGGIREAVLAVAAEVREGDTVVALGAGDVTRAADALAYSLSACCLK